MSKMVEKMNLKNLTPDIDMTEKCLTVPDINRPALQLTGFFELDTLITLIQSVCR